MPIFYTLPSEFRRGLCFECRHFDIDMWILNEDKSANIRGALACRSNGVAGESNYVCSHFEQAGDV